MKPVRGSQRRIRRLVAMLVTRFRHCVETPSVVHSIQIIRTAPSFRWALAKALPMTGARDWRACTHSAHTAHDAQKTPFGHMFLLRIDFRWAPA
jgi:hypothetical protein